MGGGATSGNQAFATAQITDGSVTGITIVNGGAGYTSVPTVTITPHASDTTATGATATAVLDAAQSNSSLEVRNTSYQLKEEETIEACPFHEAWFYKPACVRSMFSIVWRSARELRTGPPPSWSLFPCT